MNCKPVTIRDSRKKSFKKYGNSQAHGGKKENLLSLSSWIPPNQFSWKVLIKESGVQSSIVNNLSPIIRKLIKELFKHWRFARIGEFRIITEPMDMKKNFVA